jgi:hypothetical protein
MSFTSTDLAAIETAIVALSSGESVKSVTMSNGNTIEYREADLDKLIKIRSLIQRETGATHRRVYAFNKGRYSL